MKHAQKQEVKAKAHADLLTESNAAEKEWLKELEAFKALQKAKAENKAHNQELAKIKQKE